MGKIYTIARAHSDRGQVLDGFRTRLFSWHGTAPYLERGTVPSRDVTIKECSHVGEARSIAIWCSRIIADIEIQIEEQGGW